MHAVTLFVLESASLPLACIRGCVYNRDVLILLDITIQKLGRSYYLSRWGA